MLYQSWYIGTIFRPWEILILLENYWNNYFVLPTLVYCNNLPILENVVLHWKINGIVIFLYQLWYTRNIFQHWNVLLFTGKSLEYSFYFNNLDTIELENTVSSRLNNPFFIVLKSVRLTLSDCQKESHRTQLTIKLFVIIFVILLTHPKTPTLFQVAE